MSYDQIFYTVVAGIAFYHVGRIDYRNGFVTAAFSVLVSVIAFVLLKWGVVRGLCAQFGIFVVLTVINMFRKPKLS